MGYLNLKKIQFNLQDSTKSLKWGLSNDRINLTYVATFKLSLKLSHSFVELIVNNKHISRFELIDDFSKTQNEGSNATVEPPFQIEQIKFSNNFILSNTVSFIISDLSVNDLHHEVVAAYDSPDKLILNTLANSSSLHSKIKLEITENLNIDFYNSTQFNLEDVISRLNENEQYCPLKK